MSKAIEVEKGLDFSGVLAHNSEERFAGICDVLKKLGKLQRQRSQIFREDYADIKRSIVWDLFEFLPAYVNEIDVSDIVGGEDDIFITRKSYLVDVPAQEDVCWDSGNLIHYLSVLQKDIALQYSEETV